MDYKDITNSFIKEYPDYKSDVRNFSEYLEKYWGIRCQVIRFVFY